MKKCWRRFPALLSKFLGMVEELDNMKKKSIGIAVLGVIVMVVLILLDQWTKIIAIENLADGPISLIPGVFEFYYVSNYGAAWGILSGQRTFFIFITIVVMAVVAYVYVRTPKTKKYFGLVACEILLISGAIGNFIDRIQLGYVRDFLYFSLIDFPVFNVADCYVVIAAIFLCILVLFVYKDEDFEFLSFKKKKQEDE